jgi:hypothetical protein
VEVKVNVRLLIELPGGDTTAAADTGGRQTRRLRAADADG